MELEMTDKQKSFRRAQIKWWKIVTLANNPLIVADIVKQTIRKETQEKQDAFNEVLKQRRVKTNQDLQSRNKLEKKTCKDEQLTTF